MSRETWFAPQGGTSDEWLAWANRLPLADDLGMTCGRLGDGEGVFHLARAPLTPNPNGGVNGGLVAAAADQVMGALGMMEAPDGHAIATASLTVQFQRPALAPLTFHGRTTKRGRTLVFIDVDVLDGDGRLCSSAKGTMMVVPFAQP
ncbi:PaaI family thioesterase [Conexibacter sp. SYSU D00693]|uniref:PaaI family thioesterase n=1 Tax=Conexibacter sp. SYSU D00693 TaxID=2812560 RepID=UPI00196A23D5|nr:PaaI family thioesterase [Conexibacter sp. SYSU D00693]